MTQTRSGRRSCDPVDGALARAVAARERRAEMEVGQVRDPEPVERLAASPSIGTSSTRVRSQPASNQP